MSTIRRVLDYLCTKSWKAKNKASTLKTLIDGSNKMTNANMDGFDPVKLISNNTKVANIEANWVDSAPGAGIIVDVVFLKLDIFAMKASTWLTTTLG